MNRATLIRGIQLIVALTLATFAFLLWRAVTLKQADLSSALSTLNPLWLLVAAAFALQEGVCGGTRMFVLGRVLCPRLTWRTAVSSEFVLMFVAGATPGQLGAPIAQVATLVEGGGCPSRPSPPRSCSRPSAPCSSSCLRRRARRCCAPKGCWWSPARRALDLARRLLLRGLRRRPARAHPLRGAPAAAQVGSSASQETPSPCPGTRCAGASGSSRGSRS
ncbi:MAG: flippase-like domain-containing protein [Deltaproteobacteria bacterium]|nr:flippase-like domain-containing protein [Deltaproteobacteria bacterium]